MDSGARWSTLKYVRALRGGIEGRWDETGGSGPSQPLHPTPPHRHQTLKSGDSKFKPSLQGYYKGMFIKVGKSVSFT